MLGAVTVPLGDPRSLALRLPPVPSGHRQCRKSACSVSLREEQAPGLTNVGVQPAGADAAGPPLSSISQRRRSEPLKATSQFAAGMATAAGSTAERTRKWQRLWPKYRGLVAAARQILRSEFADRQSSVAGSRSGVEPTRMRPVAPREKLTPGDLWNLRPQPAWLGPAQSLVGPNFRPSQPPERVLSAQSADSSSRDAELIGPSAGKVPGGEANALLVPT